MDAELVVHNAAPMSEVVGRGVSRDQFALVPMGAFAAVAAMLAVLGLNGVLAYAVRQRRQEIGIRIALGATPACVHTLVLRQAVVVCIGLIAGIGGALVLGRWLSSLVFEISPSDPGILLFHRAEACDRGLPVGLATRASRRAAGSENRDAGRVVRSLRFEEVRRTRRGLTGSPDCDTARGKWSPSEPSTSTGNRIDIY